MSDSMGVIPTVEDPPATVEMPGAEETTASVLAGATTEGASSSGDLFGGAADEAVVAPTDGDHGVDDGERGVRSRAQESDAEDEEAGQKEEEEEVASPYMYPTGVVQVPELDLLPSMNMYETWTATPGVFGEPFENVTLSLKFEAMGAQDLTVGLAHEGNSKSAMYQLIIGNKGNLQVDLEKRQGRRVDNVASAAGLLCASNKAHKYWVAWKNGRLDFGVGDVCGQHTVLSYQDADPPLEVRYAGFTCLRHKALFRDVIMEAEVGGPLGPEVVTDLEFVRAEGCDEGFSGEDKASLDSALEQYQRECDGMKRRAQKFGTVYAPPFLQDWIPWTLVKRLSWNRDPEGGIDRQSKDEREKRKLRAERFGGSDTMAVEAASEALKAPLAARVDPELAEMMTDEKRYARSQKFSIPDQMWSIQTEEQGITPANIFCVDPDRADPEAMATTFPHKVHIFSLDKLVCKQIRDNDVKAYFEGYGPKYVEWLSDWSFNVVFGDPDEARNAAAAKSFGLPEILPKDIAESIGDEAVTDIGAMGWRLGVPMCKIMKDRWGPKGQWVRLLLRCAEAQDILLERPQTYATPEGPILRRGGGSKVPPAVRAAQDLSEGDGALREQRRGYGGGGGGGGKRRRRDDATDGAEVMGQSLKAPRTSSKRRDSGGRGRSVGRGDAKGDEAGNGADDARRVVAAEAESGVSTPVESTVAMPSDQT